MIKKLNPDIKISPKGVAYIPTETLVRRRLARISKPDTEAERQRLKDEVVEAVKRWLTELRRINATTYSEENRLLGAMKSPAILLPAVIALDKFEAENKAE